MKRTAGHRTVQDYADQSKKCRERPQGETGADHVKLKETGNSPESKVGHRKNVMFCLTTAHLNIAYLKQLIQKILKPF